MLKFITGLLSIVATSSYSTGVDTCVNQPQHGTWANGCSPVGCQQGGATMPQPYVIDLQDLTGQRIREYVPNTNYSVVLRSTNTSTGPCSTQSCFRGFVMNVGRGNLQRSNFQAVSDATTGAGIMTIHPDSALHSRPMISCPNGITHTNNDFNRNVRAIWSAPSTGTGTVTFKAIVVSTQRGLNYIASFSLPEAITQINQTLSLSPSPSVSRTMWPTRSANRTSTSTLSPARSFSGSRSSTASASWSQSASITISNTATPTSSLSGEASASNSPSASVSRSLSSSITPSGSFSSTGSVSHSPTPTASPSDTPPTTSTSSPSASSTSSQTATPATTPSLSGTQTASLTAFPTPDITTTSSASTSPTPSSNSTNNNFVIIQAGTPPVVDGTNHAVGITVGAVACLGIIVVAFAVYNRKLQRKRPHSSRVVIMPIENVTVNPSVLSPALSSRRLEIPSRHSFEPQAVRSEV